jgi:UMF1 family MFS transporter
LLCLLAAKPWLDKPLSSAEGVAAYQASFLFVAAWFLAFSVPAFLWLRESAPIGRLAHWQDYVSLGVRRVGETLSHLRRYRETAKYVLASLLFTDGITTVVSFAGIYATTTIGFSNQELVLLFLVLNIIALPGSLAAGYAADWIGAKRTIIATLVLWMGVVAIGYLATGRAAFWTMAAFAAFGMGSTQAVGRSFMAQISPPERQSEFFGFYVLSGKFASMFGPLLFGSISHWTGSQRLAVLSLLPFFVLGLVLMLWIDEKRACAVVK